MRVTVLGATGTFGAPLCDALEARGHDVVRASRATGVDAVTGVGLREALDGADVAVDALNLVTLSRRKAVGFFGTTARNIAATAEQTGLPHLVLVSIWNVTHPDASGYGYYAGKAEQERVVRSSGVPVTIVRSTPWFELAELLLATRFGPFAVAPHYLSRPAAVAAVARRVAEIVAGPVIEEGVIVAGPEQRDIHDLTVAIAAARGDTVRILGINPPGTGALKRGILVPPESVPGVGPTFEAWLAERHPAGRQPPR